VWRHAGREEGCVFLRRRQLMRCTLAWVGSAISHVLPEVWTNSYGFSSGGLGCLEGVTLYQLVLTEVLAEGHG
jgi:hypothetical protein